MAHLKRISFTYLVLVMTGMAFIGFCFFKTLRLDFVPLWVLPIELLYVAVVGDFIMIDLPQLLRRLKRKPGDTE